MNIRIISLTFLLFSASTTFASTPCDIQEIRKLNTTIRTVELSDGHCAITVDPNYPLTSGLVYRSYMFSDEGDIFVFESYGEGPDSTDTATQVYYLFPRKNSFAAKVDTDSTAILSIPSSQEIRVNLNTARIESFLGLTYDEDNEVNRDSNGGFKIKSFNGIFLKTGYKVGGVAHLNPNGLSSFVDHKGNTCSVKNNLIFNYDDRTSLKFKTDLDLKSFLQKACKQLDITTLN